MIDAKELRVQVSHTLPMLTSAVAVEAVAREEENIVVEDPVAFTEDMDNASS